MSHGHMRKPSYIIAVLCACGLVRAASTNDLVVNMSAPPPNAELGFGWLEPERNDNFSFVWMNHLDADVWVTLDAVSAAEVEIKAAHYYLDYRAQTLGLYVNGRFIREWVCRNQPEWRLDSYVAQVPDGILKPGRNRITLRAGYRVGRKGRELAIAVNSIAIRLR